MKMVQTDVKTAKVMQDAETEKAPKEAKLGTLTLLKSLVELSDISTVEELSGSS